MTCFQQLDKTIQSLCISFRGSISEHLDVYRHHQYHGARSRDREASRVSFCSRPISPPPPLKLPPTVHPLRLRLAQETSSHVSSSHRPKPFLARLPDLERRLSSLPTSNYLALVRLPYEIQIGSRTGTCPHGTCKLTSWRERTGPHYDAPTKKPFQSYHLAKPSPSDAKACRRGLPVSVAHTQLCT